MGNERLASPVACRDRRMSTGTRCSSSLLASRQAFALALGYAIAWIIKGFRKPTREAA
jgi:hypothetical protein